MPSMTQKPAAAAADEDDHGLDETPVFLGLLSEVVHVQEAASDNDEDDDDENKEGTTTTTTATTTRTGDAADGPPGGTSAATTGEEGEVQANGESGATTTAAATAEAATVDAASPSTTTIPNKSSKTRDTNGRFVPGIGGGGSRINLFGRVPHGEGSSYTAARRRNLKRLRHADDAAVAHRRRRTAAPPAVRRRTTTTLTRDPAKKKDAESLAAVARGEEAPTEALGSTDPPAESSAAAEANAVAVAQAEEQKEDGVAASASAAASSSPDDPPAPTQPSDRESGNNNDNDDDDKAPQQQPSSTRGKRGYKPNHISKKDASVATLPPIKSCPSKHCKLGCSQIINDVPHQQRLRDHYVKIVREAPKSGHAVGTAWLASMLHPGKPPKDLYKYLQRQLQKRKKPIDGATCQSCIWCVTDDTLCRRSPDHAFRKCPYRQEALDWVAKLVPRRVLYKIPRLMDGEEDGSTPRAVARKEEEDQRHDHHDHAENVNNDDDDNTITVHLDVFCALFGIGKARLETIISYHKSNETDPIRFFGTTNNGGHNRIAPARERLLLRVLGDEPSLSNPMEPNVYHYSSKLSYAYFWKKFLRKSGEDADFVAQAERLDWYHGYDRGRDRVGPTPEQIRADPAGKQLMPSVSYTTALKVYSEKIKIKFDVPPQDLAASVARHANQYLDVDGKPPAPRRKYKKRKVKQPSEDVDVGIGGDGGDAIENRQLMRPSDDDGTGDGDADKDYDQGAAADTDDDRIHPLQRTHRPGLIKECVCTNPSCPGSALDFVTVHRGLSPPGGEFGFDGLKELTTNSPCPGCGEQCHVLTIGFHDCRYKHEWKEVGEGLEMSTNWQKITGHSFFALKESTEYQYLSIFAQ